MVPELLGNKRLLSDIECDICNGKFGKLENDLANFLGPFRAMASIAGKTGTPSYSSKGKELSVDLSSDKYIDIKFLANVETKKMDNNILRIVCQGYPYKPINVYKSLLKIALSFIDEIDIPDVSDSIKFLFDNTDRNKEKDKSLFKVHQYFVPGKVETPSFILFYKKRPHLIKTPSPTINVVFYIQNLILQIFIQYHKNDHAFYDNQNKRKIFIIPPLISKYWVKEYGIPNQTLHHLNSMAVHKEPKHVIEIKLTQVEKSNIRVIRK